MRKFASILIFLLLASAAFGEDKTIDQLKAEAERPDTGQQAKLCAEVAERLVAVADKQFTDGESVKGHATVQEILQYAARSRDLSLKTRKKMKDTEIHLRRCRHALEGVRRTLAAEDRPPVEVVEKKLEQLDEDVLEAMFAPPKKEPK
ncbi:MAG: hypothetical protein WA738_07985 [Candidatus Angelobacter sp.]